MLIISPPSAPFACIPPSPGHTHVVVHILLAPHHLPNQSWRVIERSGQKGWKSSGNGAHVIARRQSPRKTVGGCASGSLIFERSCSTMFPEQLNCLNTLVLKFSRECAANHSFLLSSWELRQREFAPSAAPRTAEL
eukprot:1786178-Amphidinium_carterae.1